LQVKLLRVLEDRVVTRLGDLEPRHVDFRIIAATNRDLRALIASGDFGGDLYERLAIVSIHLAPLRERVEDIPPLAAHFIELYYAREAVPLESHVHGISADALEALAAYPWPGNIRELRNVVFATLVDKRRGDEILLSDLPRRVLEHRAGPAALAARDVSWSREAIRRAMDAGQFNLRREVEGLERAALELALSRASGSPTGAARHLGQVGRGTSRDPGGTVRAMMRRLGTPE
jgi:DNA-binding NtrC family response regulator